MLNKKLKLILGCTAFIVAIPIVFYYLYICIHRAIGRNYFFEGCSGIWRCQSHKKVDGAFHVLDIKGSWHWHDLGSLFSDRKLSHQEIKIKGNHFTRVEIKKLMKLRDIFDRTDKRSAKV